MYRKVSNIRQTRGKTAYNISEQKVKRLHHVGGKASNIRSLKSTPSPCRVFFIYRVHKDINELEIKEYLAGNNIELVSIEKLSHTD